MALNFSPLAIAFLGTTLLAIYFFAWAHRTPRKLAMVLLGYSAVQYIVGATGFYENTESLPPRFLLNILPTFIGIFWLFFSKGGKELLAGFDREKLMWLHIVRVPVELVLYGLFIAGQIPEIMTFAGNNFDIVMGLTAPAILYFGYGKNWVSPGLIKIWHIVGVILLVNIIITAILSAPFPFQQFGLEQPNVGILQAPFNLLAAVVAPLVLVAHFIGLKRVPSASAG
ncbi:MAG: hypothetical protein ACI81P_002717 [Neolewinella sp.]|jgi:hypothetical protein